VSTERPLTDAIGLVNHDVRAAILVALADHQRDHPREPTLRFSTLRERVGHDDPGNFNYHLKRLVGSFVEKHDEGYRLSEVGHHFVAVLHSGRFDPDLTREWPDADVTCLVCGGRSTVTYDDGLLQVVCEEGHGSFLNVGPELLERRSLTAALDVATRRTLLEAKSTMDGVCPYCEGATAEASARFHDESIAVTYEWACERCGALLQNDAGGCVLYHPAVVGFCHRRGVDVFDDAWTALAEHTGDGRVVGEDPLRVAVDVAVAGDRLELTLDETATVVDVTGDGAFAARPGAERRG
jgi:hypothetical protein